MYYHLEDYKTGEKGLIKGLGYKSLNNIEKTLNSYSNELFLVLDLTTNDWQVWENHLGRKDAILINLGSRLNPEDKNMIILRLKKSDKKYNKNINKMIDNYLDKYDRDLVKRNEDEVKEARYRAKNSFIEKNGKILVRGRD